MIASMLKHPGVVSSTTLLVNGQAPDLEQKLMGVHNELQQKRAVTEKLNRELEDPENLFRCSELPVMVTWLLGGF